MGLLDSALDHFKNSDFTIYRSKKLKSISEEFKKAFGVSLVIYKGMHIADDNMTLSQLNKKTTADVNFGESLKIKASMKVGVVEDMFMDTFGVRVQIKDKDAKKCVPNDITIGQAARGEY